MNTENMLAIRLSHMGDVALCTGVLDYWHETRGISFTFVTKAGLGGLFKNHPAVREVVEIEDRGLKTMAWIRTCARLARKYRGQTLVDLHGSLRSFILKRMWPGPVRAYPKMSAERRLYNKFKLEWARNRLEKLNVPQRYSLALEKTAPARKKLVPKIFLDQEEMDWADQFLAEHYSGPVVALHPYATHPNKAWIEDYWHVLVGKLAGQGLDYIVLGKSSDRIIGLDREKDFTGETGLRQTLAIISRCRAMVTGDSGPMHLATGVGTPAIALFGPTSKAWGFYPSGPGDLVLEADLDCRPCSLHGKKPCPMSRHCLEQIGPDMVLEAVMRTISIRERKK